MNLFYASSGQGNLKPLLVIINGESNSGGYALNSQAPSGEIGVRDSVLILNNTTLTSFDTLNIGGNNITGHTGLSNGVIHGFELELANEADIERFYKQPVHLIKTGQGGSTIAQWNIGGGYLTTFTDRITAAKSLINFADYRVVLLFSLGINDAIAGTNVNTWKTGILAHFVNLRSIVGIPNLPIIMTEFETMGGTSTAYDTYTSMIQTIASEDPNVYSVDATGATKRDANHWDYYGMKLMSSRLLTVAKTLNF